MFCAHGLWGAEDGLPFLLGADVSLAPEIERAGAVFKDGGKPTDIFALFRVRGANYVRLRLFVQPNGKNGGVNDLAYTVALARRVKAAGLLFSLDFHYSDTWADPGHQATPAAWSGLSFPALVEQVRAYTAQSLKAFREAGVTPDVVQIGNEITTGMLWPMCSLSDQSAPEATRFDRLATLLKAAADGARNTRRPGRGRVILVPRVGAGEFSRRRQLVRRAGRHVRSAGKRSAGVRGVWREVGTALRAGP